jgi:hypothetical protein
MFAIGLLATGILLGADSTSPRFDVLSTAEKELRGTIDKLDADGRVVLSDGEFVSSRQLIGLRRVGRPTPSWPDGPQIILHNGDRIAGSILAIDGPIVRLRAIGIRNANKMDKDGTLRVPSTAISMLWFRTPANVDVESNAALLSTDRIADQVLLRNGDIISGTVNGLDSQAQELQIESNAERRAVAASKVVVIACSTRLARIRRPTGAYFHLVLANGTRLTVLSPTIENGTLFAETLFKDKLSISLNDIASLDVYQGKAVYLSDMKPSKYEYRSHQGEEYSWAADRNLSGADMQIRTADGIATFDKGIAVHGECQLTFALDGKFKRFEATVGLDARLGKRGSAEIRVRVDGKEHKINDGKALTANGAPFQLSIDVKGANELAIIVLGGNGGNVSDHVNWCDARLIP